MDKETNDCDEKSRLIEVRTLSESYGINLASTSAREDSTENVIYEPDSMKSSKEDLEATWDGQRRSLPESRRLRRAHSWSAGPPDDVSSEIRILRERLLRTQSRPRPGAVRLLTRRQRLTLVSLALVDFMSFCSMSVMAPFFPSEANAKGLSNTVCGLVFSFYAVVMFITSPFMGKSLPVVGVKFMFIAGMFVAGTCNIIFGSLVLIDDTVLFTTLCFVVRGMEALGASAYSTASYVFVVHAFPDSIGSVLGILETFVGLGMSVGPALGGLLYSIGGFGLPFYSLGVIMVLTVPISYFLLADCEDYVASANSTSILSLFKIPSIIITGLVIVVVSNTWAFLDPTLEPHLRQFGLSAKQIGLVFLLFSGLYGIFSPIWGWVADRVHNHWCMMVWGLFLCSISLLLLGPCPYIPGLSADIWLDLLALSILSISVALTLLPTFQGVLASSIYEGGCPEGLTTYSAVAGVWSCCYSLGEVLGPALGGAFAELYGFPLSATLNAACCLTMAVVALAFFSLRDSSKWVYAADSCSDSIPYSDSTWTSSHFCRTRSAPESRLVEASPLLTSCSLSVKNGFTPYQSSTPMRICLKHKNRNKNGSVSILDSIANFLKFQYVTDTIIELRRRSLKNIHSDTATSNLYQNYLDKNEVEDGNRICSKTNNNLLKMNGVSRPDTYCSYLETTIFGSQGILDNVNLDNLIVKRNNKGLIAKTSNGENETHPTEEIIRHNIEKVYFYEQIRPCTSIKNIFDACECKDDVTFVKGTVAVSSTGACEV